MGQIRFSQWQEVFNLQPFQEGRYGVEYLVLKLKVVHPNVSHDFNFKMLKTKMSAPSILRDMSTFVFGVWSSFVHKAVKCS